jgi:ABC-type phosphate transport system substrate-binding protein
MRKLSKLFTGAVTMAAAAALVAGTVTTASAAPKDPPKGITPQIFDIVAVGSNTTEFLWDQLSQNYNSTVKVHNSTHPWVFSWDAVKPGTTSTNPTTIVPKATCKPITRPNGSTSGWKALNAAQKVGKNFCIDFSRSSGARASGSTGAPKTLTYVEFARDAITWSTRTAAHGGSDAPKSLSLNPTQLKGIFNCKVTNWATVGGKKAAIKVYLPQAGSGTLATWEKFMGINPNAVPKCISQAPEENEGTFAGFNSPNAIFIYSIGAYVAQKFHKNAFGANLTGVLGINKINGISPITSAKVPTINPSFPSSFFRTLFDVVRGTASIDPRLVGLLGPKGYVCTNKTAKQDIVNYGFLNDPHCGALS